MIPSAPRASSPRTLLNSFSSLMLDMAALLALATLPFAASADQITIKGSDTMLLLNRELAAEYTVAHPRAIIDVEGRGSESGIRALLANETDIPAASRRMKESELAEFEQKFGERPEEIIIALDGIGVYVHSHNPVTTLSVDQLAQLLSGEIREWREVGGYNRRVNIYNRDLQSGTRAFIQEHVLGTRAFSPNALDISSTALLTTCVSRDQSALGYGGIGYAVGAHIIRISHETGNIGYWPSQENVSSGKYPLSRPLYYYLNPNSLSQQTRDFVNWVISPAGQEVVLFVGYFAAPSVENETGPTLLEEIYPIYLSPENIRQMGFGITMETDALSEEGMARQIVTIRFDRNMQAISRVATFSLLRGDAPPVAVRPDDQMTIRLVISPEELETTALLLGEAGAPENGASWKIPLTSFLAPAPAP